MKRERAVPVRLQLSRRHGFNLQELSMATNGLPAVNVARPGKWGNPFIVSKDGTRDECCDWYSLMLCGQFMLCGSPSIAEMREAKAFVCENIEQLRGHNLACWCRAGRCHADTLLRIAKLWRPGKPVAPRHADPILYARLKAEPMKMFNARA